MEILRPNYPKHIEIKHDRNVGKKELTSVNIRIYVPQMSVYKRILEWLDEASSDTTIVSSI